MDYKRLGERIREERLRLHLTQAQLAEAVDISDTYMGAIERGERSLTLDTLVRLVNRLGVTVDYLLADSVIGVETSTDVIGEVSFSFFLQPATSRSAAAKYSQFVFIVVNYVVNV